MQRLNMAFAPAFKQKFAGTMARKTVNKNSYVCSQHFEASCFIKPMGGQIIRLKPDSVPKKVYIYCRKTKEEKARQSSIVEQKAILIDYRP